jgi:hypothetical protein
MDIYQKFGPTSFAVIERRLSRGEFVAPADLALAIEANPDVALPSVIRDYLIGTLQGDVKARRGRKPPGPAAQLLNLYALILYEHYLPRLQARWRRYGRPVSNRGQNAPHQRAAQLVARRLGRNQSYRHILNLVSRTR